MKRKNLMKDLSAMILKFDNVSFTYKNDEVNAIKDLSFCVENKSFICIVGESGCGKTTFLKLLSGVLTPDKGHIYINNEDVTDLTVQSHDIAYVYQGLVLYPHMTVYENILQGLNGYGLSQEEKMEKVKKYIIQFGLENYINFKPRNLSYGQAQKVAICKALIREPSIMLLDEPLANIDIIQKRGIVNLLKKIYEKSKTTFIYVTHDIGEIEKIIDEVVIMEDGKFVQKGTAKEIRANPSTLKANYIINRGQINNLDVMATKGSIYLNGIAILENLQIEDGNYHLVIPYKAIHIANQGLKGAYYSTKLTQKGKLLITILIGEQKLNFITDSEEEYKEKDDIYISIDTTLIKFYKY